MSDTSALKLFVRVARTGSFSKAGREVGLSQPSASRVIAALERELGASLLTRSTRAVVLTDAGADYLARVEPLLDALEQANQAARGTSELRGTLRVGLPLSIALRLVIPHLPAFMAPHPSLRVDLLMDDRRQDLLRDGIDVALRVGELVDDAAVTRVVGVNERLLAASPAYLARAGTPATPQDLAKHALIVGTPATLSSAWSFERDGVRETVRVEPRMTASVNEAATAAAVAGLGIISNGRWGCGAELDDGRLVRVLRDWKLRSGELHAVFPAGRAAKPSARAFADFLVSVLR